MFDQRGLHLFAVILAFGAATLAATACAGPAAGTVSFGAGESDATNSSSDPTAPAGSGAAAAPAGGATTQNSPIFGTTAFTAGTATGGPAKGKSDHSSINAQLDPSGVDCMTCHASTFAFGGTLYADASGSAPVAGAEIRVVGPDGKTYASAFSDADGNFWSESTGTVMPAGSKVGVRNGTAVMSMSGTIGGANAQGCNNAACHGSPTNRTNLH